MMHAPCFPRNRCQKKTCQTCAQYRRFRVAERLAPKMRRKRIAHVTLTVPNGSDLMGALGDLQRAFKKLTRLAVWNVTGYLRVIQIDYGNGGWHPHMHVVVDGELDALRLAQEWQRLTGATQTYVGDVAPAFQDLERVATYVANHNQDSFDADERLMREYAVATHGVRLYAASGTLKVPTTRQRLSTTFLRRLRRSGWSLPVCMGSEAIDHGRVKGPSYEKARGS